MHTQQTFNRRQTGFTLPEIMFALAIVGILVSMAYPSFMDSLRQSRRSDAHSALLIASNKLERFFSANDTYTTDEELLGFFAEGDSPALSAGGHYTITVTPGNSGISSSYVVTAAAAAGQQQDAGCTTLTVDSTGRRTPDPRTSSCW